MTDYLNRRYTMKTIRPLILTTTPCAATVPVAAEQSSTPPPATPASAAGDAKASSVPKPAPAAPDSTTQNPAPPAQPGTDAQASETAASPATGEAAEAQGTKPLRMNFHGASLDLVLNYLSEAAGYIINVKPGTSVKGKVDVWSNESLSREEAVNLLDTVLNQNGLAAIRNGRTITIVNRDEAKTQNIPVIQGSDPEKIPVTDKIVTQIIPVRFVEVVQLVKDLQPLVSDKTTITANEAGNSIVITETQANIRKVAEIIKAIDTGAEEFTEVRVFHLTNSDPTVVSEMLGALFPDDTKSGSSQSPVSFNPFFSRFASRFGGFGGGPPSTSGGSSGGGGGQSNQNQRIKKRNRVIAVADERTASVVVSATRDLMEQIGDVVTELDANPKGKRMVHVIHLNNADAQEVLPVLNDIFAQQNQNNRNTANQNSALVNRSASQNSQNTSGSRTTMTPSSTSRGAGAAPSFP